MSSPVMGYRLGRELARRGCDGVCVEDSAYPKANSFSALDDHETCAPDRMAAIIRSLRAGAADAGCDLTVVARTEVLIAGHPLAAALDRMASYRDAGADAVIAHSKDVTGEEPLAVADAWDGSVPLGCIPTAFPQLGLQELGRAGYRLCIFANQLMRASIAAMQAVLADVRVEGRFWPPAPRIVSMQRLFSLTDETTRSSVESGQASAAG
jgi:phosphoenolpyruvate phosphomutase